MTLPSFLDRSQCNNAAGLPPLQPIARSLHSSICSTLRFINLPCFIACIDSMVSMTATAKQSPHSCSFTWLTASIWSRLKARRKKLFFRDTTTVFRLMLRMFPSHSSAFTAHQSIFNGNRSEFDFKVEFLMKWNFFHVLFIAFLSDFSLVCRRSASLISTFNKSVKSFVGE